MWPAVPIATNLGPSNGEHARWRYLPYRDNRPANSWKGIVMHDANTTREVPLVPDTLFYGIKSNGELLAASIGLSRWGLSNCNIFSSFRLWRCCTRASSARLSTVLRLDGWAAAFAAMPPGPRADWCAGREAMKPKPRADDAGRKPWLMARCHPLSRAGSAAANSALPMALPESC